MFLAFSIQTQINVLLNKLPGKSVGEREREHHHKVDENCTLLGYYMVRSGNYLPTFWHNLLVQYSGVKIPKRKLAVPIWDRYREECG